MLVLALSLAFAGSAASATEAKNPNPAVRLRRFAEAPSQGFQAVRADLKGRAKVLTEDFSVYEVVGSSSLKLAVKLKTSELPVLPIVPALSGDGKRWLVAAEAGRVLLFDGEKGLLLPRTPLPVNVLGFAGSDPLVGSSVDPQLLSTLPEEERSAPPYIWSLDGTDWEPIVHLVRPAKGGLDGEQLALATLSLVAADARDRFWVANAFTYDVRKLTAGGRELARAQDPAMSEPPKPTAEQRERMAAQVKASGIPADKVTAVVVIPEARIRAITAWFGDAFLLVATPGEEGYAVDRIDGSSGEVTRVAISVPRPETLHSMAATNEGLVFAAARASGGLWFADWTSIEAGLNPAKGAKTSVTRRSEND